MDATTINVFFVIGSSLASGLCAGVGTAAVLRTDIKWLTDQTKSNTQELNAVSGRVSTIEGKLSNG
ncbi:hypothetical protein [Photobacterium halotolerans]|uniref:Uncharacterized protein n=1 Tax=Photobacterium halotolerans TaxID=265726 RepID=A0A7X4WCF6_9GAMM|nr:hypothetical protein [Photobacterium halotolerans]NAW66149.1 hypothetical protein [Photobacterium halotolerans]